MLWAIRIILIAACLPLLLPPGFCPCWFETPHARTDAGESQWSELAPQHPCHCHDNDPLTGLPVNSDGSNPIDPLSCCIGFANWDATLALDSGIALIDMAVGGDSANLQDVRRRAPKSASPTRSASIFPPTPLYLRHCTLLI